ncbi:Isochorismatase hydrolase [Aspergillus eucalypticola CBS 122712]|uniref:Isochorismatase hydrolase n=1 Tax=Aspergillus eucalypticola (strain CBS 122712 / IBT 29274) TaxID=1448314 RepID=A0A317VMJ2_ASPEC|nr:Isochorismatase hydrolase [Aspergillus eucalypticola CBS 122712]PWY75576.1 Isochorismatase hydrolase [Aspergillus eucalypticola CBS 122712]
MASLSRVTRINNPALFICDLQEKFRHAIYEFPKVISTTTKLLRASTPLNIPIYITTQSRSKLGPTVPELTTHLTSNPLVRADLDKTLFSMITPRWNPFSPPPRKGKRAWM